MLYHMSGWSYLRSSFNGKSISDDTSLHAPNKKWRDGKIFTVDRDVIKEMVTIQTMLDNLGEDDSDDEPIPIYTVDGEVLGKLIGWTRYSNENLNHSHYKVWCKQFFMDNLEESFLFEEAADYLELKSFLTITESLIDNNFQILTETEAFKNISRERLSLLLARESLNVQNEDAVLKSLFSWISVDLEERSQNLQYLLPHIRACYLSKKYLDVGVKSFLVKCNLLSSYLKLNFGHKTPRDGYEQCIVVLHEMSDGVCLKYFDIKVSCCNVQ